MGEKEQEIININRKMMVKDTWSEPGHPNQNPAKNRGVKELKKGVEMIMNATGAADGAWPWVCKCLSVLRAQQMCQAILGLQNSNLSETWLHPRHLSIASVPILGENLFQGR